ncbi:hypothetical protein ACFLW1_03575, partial [Chloroflexota bacterium]
MKNRVLLVICSLVLIVPLFSMMACSEPEAQNAADFYNGKTLTIMVTSTAGGGTDLNARILASFLGNEMGCGVVIQNQPAGGGNVARTELMKSV